MANPLNAIATLGQSVWYDNLSRELLKSGELKRLIDEDGITGVTSNPTIFEKSLSSEKIYENDLHLLVDSGLNPLQIYEALVIEDIQEAADLLMPIFEDSNGIDIKVPATSQGVEASRELMISGINVNFTLIFSLEQYKAVASAYLQALEQILLNGDNPGKISSVASFFVSRVDTVIDQRISDSADPTVKAMSSEILGKAAIANAKLAYVMYKELFRGPRFAKLALRGAKPQRIVWASTSTKNPAYPDTYYVDHLLGPETINTIPTATLNAFRDHGIPVCRIEDEVDSAELLFSTLEGIGISIPEIMETLLEDGIKAFADSYTSLIAEIEQKRTRLLRGWGHRSASLGDLQQHVGELYNSFDSDKISESMWSGDVSIWSDDPDSGIGQRLGWLHIIETMAGEEEKLKEFANEIRNEFQHVLLLGMGGSSLGAEVFVSCFPRVEGYPELIVLDTTVPDTIFSVEQRIDLSKTLFIVASKSGGTIEVMSLYKYFRSRMEQLVGTAAGSHFIAITDPGTSLGKLASEAGFRRTFLNPPDIGGRFSALSYFGLVPAALIGVGLNRLIMRALQAVEATLPDVPALENPGIWLGIIIGEAARRGKDKLTIMISPPIKDFGLWLEQLIAESTGKEGTGILPIVNEPIGNVDSYGDDRLFVYLRLDGDTTYDQAVVDLEKSGFPVVTQRLHTEYDIGREMFRWEFATAVAGIILKINPFDQPNVQEAKDATKKLLSVYKEQGRLPKVDELQVSDPGFDKSLTHYFSDVKPKDYVALNCFVTPEPLINESINKIRGTIRDGYKVATTAGFGPRYLHSTGQIHKGGAPNGCFIQITAADQQDMKIPGDFFSFGVLKDAQATGDLEALKVKGRRIVRVHLNALEEIEELSNAIEKICEEKP